MFSYYLKLGLLSLRGNPLLSLLMVAAIGVGIGACMTVLTVNYTMSGNPIPHKSDRLFHIQLDSWDANDPGETGYNPPDQVTYNDAMAIMRDAPDFRRVVNNRSGLVLEPAGDDENPFTVDVRNTWADFFPMFEPPFLYGGGWDDAADENREPVVVLSRALNERVFGGRDAVGERVRMSGMDFRVVGVLDEWLPVPKFYDVTNGPFNEPEEAYIPFNLAIDQEFSRSGNTNCWKRPEGDGFEAFKNSECVWIQAWVELRDANEVAEFTDWLDAYVTEQKSFGRFPRPLNNRVLDVMDWLEDQQVVDDDVGRVQAATAAADHAPPVGPDAQRHHVFRRIARVQVDTAQSQKQVVAPHQGPGPGFSGQQGLRRDVVEAAAVAKPLTHVRILKIDMHPERARAGVPAADFMPGQRPGTSLSIQE